MYRINHPAVRICVVTVIVFVTYGIARFVNAELEPPGVEMPDWKFSDMPLELGAWHGETTADLDDNITKATEAKPETIVNRVYRNDRGGVITMHAAMYDDPRNGVRHAPTSCYRSNGWQKLEDTREDLHITDDLTIPVSVTTWGRKGEKLVVVFWYQLGEHVLFERWDLGIKVRWSLRGRTKWPALIKVMLQIPARDPEEAKPVILDFAKQVAAWMNQPQHHRQTSEMTSPASESQP